MPELAGRIEFAHEQSLNRPLLLARAPPTGELGKVDFSRWFANNPYAEWYLNSIRLKDSQTWRHHAKTHGEDFAYYWFAETVNRETAKWQPGA